MSKTIDAIFVTRSDNMLSILKSEIEDSLPSWYASLDCSTIDILGLKLYKTDEWVEVVLDDEGKFTDKFITAVILTKDHTKIADVIVGKIAIVSSDDEGELTSVNLTCSQVKDAVVELADGARVIAFEC